MNKIILKSLIILPLLLTTTNVMANAGMPGFWDVGTARTLLPAFSEDIKDSEQIEMQSENIKVNLYPGFAIVKGEYYMLNTSKKNINIHVGYPENGIFINKILDNVIFNELSNLEVYIDKKKVPVSLLKSNLEKKSTLDKWYVWQNKFESKKLTKITVYYMVDTHFAHLHMGYDTSEGNGFAYILESGKLWKNKISHGNIIINLMEGLNRNDIVGILPKSTLEYDKESNSIRYKFSNLEPSQNDNIIIRYKDRTDKFKFDKIKSNYKNYYSEIDKSVVISSPEHWETITESNFEIFPMTMYILLGILCFIILGIILFIYGLVRIFRKK